MEGKDLQNEIVEAASTKAAAITNEAMETKTNAIEESLNTKTAELTDNVLKLAKSIDEVKEMSTKNVNIGAAKRSPQAEFIKASANDLVKAVKSGGKVDLSLKDFSAGSGADNYAIYSENRIDDIKYDPNHSSRLSTLLGVSSSEGGALRYNRETAETDSAGPKAKGAAGTQSSVTITPITEAWVTLFNPLTIPQEWLDDTPAIESFLSKRLLGNLYDVEDIQALTGDGTGQNYSGINNQGTTATQAGLETLFGGLADSFGTAANEFDALVATAQGMKNQGFRPTKVILNPIDKGALMLLKASTNEYLIQQTVTPDGSIKEFWNGMEIIEHQAQTAGVYTMIDPMHVDLYRRQGASFRFGYNDTDFISNEITAVAKMRGGVAVYNPNGARNQTFAHAIAALNA